MLFVFALGCGEGRRIASFGIKGNEQQENTNYNFHSMGDPTRKKAQQCIDAANKKILDYLESQS